MSRNRLLSVVSVVLLSLLAFLVWQHVEPATAVNSGGSAPQTTAKTGTVEH